MKKRTLFFQLILLLLFSACAKQVVKKPVYNYAKMDKTTRSAHKRVEKFLQSCIEKKYPVKTLKVTRIDSVVVQKEKRHLDIYLNKFFAYIPFREKNSKEIYTFLRKKLGRKFRKYSIVLYSKQIPIEALVPNFFRSDTSHYDRSRMPKKEMRPKAVVRNISKPWQATKGLNNRNVALWHSHGWYYEQKRDRWEWQRARLFQTVEDLGPIQFTLPYIVPMLESAGANVFLPRERDVQPHEVIVDADSSAGRSRYKESITDTNFTWRDGDGSGFSTGDPPYATGENPFRTGSYRIIKSARRNSAGAVWIPDIPEDGEYAVTIAYVSLDNSVDDAHYTVYHRGGKTEFLVNQKIGGGTWIYLGKFKFKAGMHPDSGRVVLTNESKTDGMISADAVRFGGGMGNVIRNGRVSGRPRFVEGARYYLQYAGMPDTLVFSLHHENDDYKDDYQSRGEWVDYLKGAPFGPNKDRTVKGLGIPIDLSLAFHTDAGITHNDTVIGTLLIYCTDGADSTKLFPDGMSRLANRDLADIMQTQIVDDIRAKYDPAWNRRGMWDSDYSEAYRPNVPAVLLELLSHQNFLDMKFARDPRFRFDVSRSVYKSMLKFLATQFQFDYVVQPLPVTHFQALFSGERQVTLKWRPVVDPLEKTAMAEKYIVYTRENDGDFNNGILTARPEMTLADLRPGVIYSFKVTAVNAGGESFPSEILSVCWLNREDDPVLIVNGFDRVAPPATIELDKFTGFADFWDQGVPDKYAIGYTGSQYDFDPASKMLDDEAPGHGASYGNLETKIIPGNSFDFPYTHGVSLRAAGVSFVSCSDEAVMDRSVALTGFKTVDLILGEERETPWPRNKGEKQFKAFPTALQDEISRFCQAGGNLFLSGSYIGTDLFQNSSGSNRDKKFARKILKYVLRTDHAAKTGGVDSYDSLFTAVIPSFRFNTEFDESVYAAESPDAIIPVRPEAKTILRYAENNVSAATAYHGDYHVVAFGFPFETILTQEARNKVMRAVLDLLK